MTSANLENLVRIGQLKKEPPDAREIEGLMRSGRSGLADLRAAPSLSLESRFQLAYNAAHSLALAALRRQGYRADSRYIVFQVLATTAGLSDADWRVLALCHEKRNALEYHGALEVDEKLVAALVGVAGKLQGLLEKR